MDIRKNWLLYLGIGGALVLGLLYVNMAKAHAADKDGVVTRAAAEKAAPPITWTGCGIGVLLGTAAMDTKASYGTPAPGSMTMLEVDGLGASGAVYGGRLGCDVRLPNTNVVLGAYTSWQKYNSAAWNLDTMPGIPAAHFNVTTGLDSSFDVGARLGFIVMPSALLYGQAAFSQLKMDAISASLGGVAIGAPLPLSIPDINGWKVGGGLEVKLPGNWSLAGEYNYFMAESVAITLPGGGGIVNIDPTVHTFTARATYNFNLGQ